jgi:hypothetical protein
MWPDEYELEKDLKNWSAYLRETCVKLEDSNDFTQQEAARAVWLAGEEIVRFRMRMAGRSASEEDLPKKAMPEWLEANIKTQMGKCKDALDALREYRTCRAALTLCEEDRRAMILLFLARSDSSSTGYLREFRTIVDDAIEEKEDLSKLLKSKAYDDESELVQIFASSEQRRLNIIDAMLEPNMSKAYRLMWDAISQTAADRPRRLQLAAKVNYGENLG